MSEGKRGECGYRFIKGASESEMSEGGRVGEMLIIEIVVDFEVGDRGRERTAQGDEIGVAWEVNLFWVVQFICLDRRE